MAFNTTRATLRARIQDRLLTNFWSNAEVNAAINEALRVWNTLTGFYRGPTSKAITTQFYDIAANVTDFLALIRADTDDSIHLDIHDIETYDNADPDWQNNSTGTPSDAIVVGLNVFALDPPPASSTSVTFHSVEGAVVPTTDGSTIQLSEEDLAAIVDYVHFILSIKEGGQELQDNLPLFRHFLNQAARHNDKLSKRSVFRNLLGIPQSGPRPNRPSRLREQ